MEKGSHKKLKTQAVKSSCSNLCVVAVLVKIIREESGCWCFTACRLGLVRARLQVWIQDPIRRFGLARARLSVWIQHPVWQETLKNGKDKTNHSRLKKSLKNVFSRSFLTDEQTAEFPFPKLTCPDLTGISTVYTWEEPATILNLI